MLLNKNFTSLIINNLTKTFRLTRCYLSTDRRDTISSALKKFYLKVHPDLFTQFPREKDINEKSLQLVSAYLSGLQRKEYMPSISVTFYTKKTSILPPSLPVQLSPHRVTLNSRDLLTCVNSILNSLSLPVVQIAKEQKRSAELQFKIIEIEKFYDFTKIPKLSIETWLTNNVEAARIRAKKHEQQLNEIREKIDRIQNRFKLKSIEYSDEWSVAQFNACLSTLLAYADKWHDILTSLEGKRLIFGDKTSLLQNGSLELGANDPPVYWDHVICCELIESDKYMNKIVSYENNLSEYFHNIEIQHDPDSEHLSRAHTYLYHLLQISQHLDLNRQHDAHRKYSWKNFSLFINPYSSDPSLTNSGRFQINAYDATMDILEFMIRNRTQANQLKESYRIESEKENHLLENVRKQLNLHDLIINRRMKKSEIIQCCQHLLNQRQYFTNLLAKCRLKIDKHYNLAQNGTISIPWDWSFAQAETL